LKLQNKSQNEWNHGTRNHNSFLKRLPDMQFDFKVRSGAKWTIGIVLGSLQPPALYLRCIMFPVRKGPVWSDTKIHWGTGRASDVDHSCEHPVHGVSCCYAGGKHLVTVLDVQGFRRHSWQYSARSAVLEKDSTWRAYQMWITCPRLKVKQSGDRNRDLRSRKSNALTTTQPCHSVIEHWNVTCFLQTTDCLLSSRPTPQTRIRTNVLDSSFQKKSFQFHLATFTRGSVW